MGASPIEWIAGDDGSQGHTINPFRARNIETGAVGHFCTKISPGCKKCYSSRLQPRMGLFPFLAENRPKVELFFDEKPLLNLMLRKKPTRVFPWDMTDAFMDEYPDEWIDKCFAYFALMPQHTFYVLTKRHQRLLDYAKGSSKIPGMPNVLLWEGAHARVFHAMVGILPNADPHALNRASAWQDEHHPDGDGFIRAWTLQNVRLGVSVEDKQRADERFPVACELGEMGWNTMVSIEPLLESVTIPDRYLRLGSRAWVIVGGESGPAARPFDVEWGREIIRQCKGASVQCFFKQLGSRPFHYGCTGPGEHWPDVHWAGESGVVGAQSGWFVKIKDRKGGDMSEWPEDLRVRQFPGKANA